VISIATGEAPRKQQKHQDVLTYRPVLIKFLRDEEAVRMLKDANYYPIIKILRKGPMTVRELEEAYSKEAAKSESCEPKSDKTIYRYLKALEKAGLVVPAGQRVVMGKTATETLFSRTAHVFNFHGKEPVWWKSEKGEQSVRWISILLGRFYNNREPSIKCLQNFIIQFETAKEVEFKKLLATADKKILEHITAGEWYEMKETLDYIEHLNLLLSQPDLLERLRSCFK
jgi:DNA-binding transcriptional ArsR family regulator